MTQYKDFRDKPFPEKPQASDFYDSCALVTTKDEAGRYFKKLVDFVVENYDQDRIEVEKIQRSNIGYYAGYLDRETQLRIYDLFDVDHPIFGRKQPTADEAFQMGKDSAAGKSIEQIREEFLGKDDDND